MKRKIAFLFLIGIGTAIILIPFPRPGRAASLSPPENPSCNSFGIQKFPKGKTAPAFSLKSLNGGQVSLSDFRGKPVLITFWATWCDSCKEEMPILEKFSQGKRDQLTILLIAVDGERKRAVQTIVDKNKVTLPVLLLLKEKVMDQYEVRGWLPLTFLVDQEGMLVGKIIGQRDWSSAEAWSCMKELFSLR
ncbi:MAG TPA: TlpA family protein disulfide reductase [Thermodesulfobacteriota bacterium]|nr:TlpA family protein disulfide reductase [Thermodesulfobacteriota bacterium]